MAFVSHSIVNRRKSGQCRLTATLQSNLHGPAGTQFCLYNMAQQMYNRDQLRKLIPALALHLCARAINVTGSFYTASLLRALVRLEAIFFLIDSPVKFDFRIVTLLLFFVFISNVPIT